MCSPDIPEAPDPLPPPAEPAKIKQKARKQTPKDAKRLGTKKLQIPLSKAKGAGLGVPK